MEELSTININNNIHITGNNELEMKILEGLPNKRRGHPHRGKNISQEILNKEVKVLLCERTEKVLCQGNP